jgi:hypothetical protein
VHDWQQPIGQRDLGVRVSNTNHCIWLRSPRTAQPLNTATAKNLVLYGCSPLPMPKNPRYFGSYCHSGSRLPISASQSRPYRALEDHPVTGLCWPSGRLVSPPIPPGPKFQFLEPSRLGEPGHGTPRPELAFHADLCVDGGYPP